MVTVMKSGSAFYIIINRWELSLSRPINFEAAKHIYVSDDELDLT